MLIRLYKRIRKILAPKKGDNFAYFVFIYVMVGLSLIDALILTRDLIFGSISGYHYPGLSLLAPLLPILLIYPLRKYVGSNKIIMILITISFGIMIMYVTQTVLLWFSSILTGFSSLIMATGCVCIYANKFDEIKSEICRLKSIPPRSDISDHLSMLHDDVRFFLDKIINGLYWMMALLIGINTILWGMYGKISNADFYSFPAWTLIFLILFIYVGLALSLWIVAPLYLYLNELRNISIDRIEDHETREEPCAEILP